MPQRQRQRALLIDRQHDRVGRRVDIKADDVAQLLEELGIGRELEPPPPCGCKPCASQMRRPGP